MKEYTCRCGTNKKRFKFDLGADFYIEECCEKAGYDHRGNLKQLSEGESVSETELNSVHIDDAVGFQPNEEAPTEPKTKPSSASFLKKLIGLKPGRGKLRDMTRDQLVKMASDKGIEVKEGVTKNELIALILG